MVNRKCHNVSNQIKTYATDSYASDDAAPTIPRIQAQQQKQVQNTMHDSTLRAYMAIMLPNENQYGTAAQQPANVTSA